MCIRFAMLATGESDFSISSRLKETRLRKIEVKNSPEAFVLRFNSIHWNPSLPIKTTPKIVMSTVYVIMNGRFSARIPKLDLRPPNNEEERSENVAAEATSRMLATTPKNIDIPQMNFPLLLKVWRINWKVLTKVSPSNV